MCGIAGVFNSPYASQFAFLQIYSLQHRGQESVGISSSDGGRIRTVKRGGRVLEAIRQEDLDFLKGSNAIAHVRYSTAGNIVNYLPLRKELEERGIAFEHSSDTELFLTLLETGEGFLPEDVRIHERDRRILPRLFYVLTRLEGAYSFLMLWEDKLIAGRDLTASLCSGRTNL